jgi:hypothetical protein
MDSLPLMLRLKGVCREKVVGEGGGEIGGEGEGGQKNR